VWSIADNLPSLFPGGFSLAAPLPPLYDPPMNPLKFPSLPGTIAEATDLNPVVTLAIKFSQMLNLDLSIALEKGLPLILKLHPASFTQPRF
jgi:hypothetical protein